MPQPTENPLKLPPKERKRCDHKERAMIPGLTMSHCCKCNEARFLQLLREVPVRALEFMHFPHGPGIA